MLYSLEEITTITFGDALEKIMFGVEPTRKNKQAKDTSRKQRSQEIDVNNVKYHLNHNQMMMARIPNKPIQTIFSLRLILSLLVVTISVQQYFLNNGNNQQSKHEQQQQEPENNLAKGLILLASGHIVLTRDDRGSSLVLTGEDGKGGKGKGKGESGDQLVIAGHNMGGGGDSGGGQNTNMVVQDASNREGDVVINGNTMIVPGEDGHIVLADGRGQENGQQRPPPPPPNLFAFWLPYMNSRMGYRMMPFFGGQFG